MEVKRKGREALANQPLIPSPQFDEEEFFEIANVPLLEDRPDVARARQARTRYEELPTLPVVWLRAEDAAKAEVRKGDRDAVRELLRSSAGLRGYWVAALYGDQFLPSSWRDNAILGHHRLLTVTGGRYQIPDGPELSLDDELGMVIRFKSRAGAEEVQPD